MVGSKGGAFIDERGTSVSGGDLYHYQHGRHVCTPATAAFEQDLARGTTEPGSVRGGARVCVVRDVYGRVVRPEGCSAETAHF